MAPPSCSTPTPSAQAGVIDDNHNLINSSYMMKIAGTPNGEGGGEAGGSRWRLSVKGHWRPSEDVKLRELVALHGPRNWNIISEQIPGRSGKSCRLRWVNQLDPRIKKTLFSKEEDAVLTAAHAVFGNKWSQIAKYFPGRTDNAIKNHWNVLTPRRQKHVTVVSSPCSSYSRDRPVSGGSTSGSTGSTITLNGKSTLVSEGTSFSCMNAFTSRSVPAVVNSGDGGYYKKAMAAGGGCYCHMAESGTFMPSTTGVATISPLVSLKSNTATSHVSGGDGAILVTSPPSMPFIDFLGVGEQCCYEISL